MVLKHFESVVRSIGTIGTRQIFTVNNERPLYAFTIGRQGQSGFGLPSSAETQLLVVLVVAECNPAFFIAVISLAILEKLRCVCCEVTIGVCRNVERGAVPVIFEQCDQELDTFVLVLGINLEEIFKVHIPLISRHVPLRFVV